MLNSLPSTKILAGLLIVTWLLLVAVSLALLNLNTTNGGGVLTPADPDAALHDPIHSDPRIRTTHSIGGRGVGGSASALAAVTLQKQRLEHATSELDRARSTLASDRARLDADVARWKAERADADAKARLEREAQERAAIAANANAARAEIASRPPAPPPAAADESEWKRKESEWNAERERFKSTLAALNRDRLEHGKNDDLRNEQHAIALAAAQPRTDAERALNSREKKCLEEKAHCERERKENLIAMRDAIVQLQPKNTFLPTTDPAQAGAGAQVLAVPAAPSAVPRRADGKVDFTQKPKPNYGSAALLPGRDWPSVSVTVPVCNMRHKWLPNLYRMFAHQDYPGPIELVVMDGVCSRVKRILPPSQFMIQTASDDPRVRYYYFHTNATADPPSLGAKRNWLARNATGAIVAHMDVDDYYGPAYISRMVVLLQESGPKCGMVKLHAWFSLGEGWLYDPLRRYKAFTYIDMEVDPLGWGWTYVYWRKLFTGAVMDGHVYSPPAQQKNGPKVQTEIGFGDVDASEEAGFFHSLVDIGGFTVRTYADRWYLALRIVTRSIVRTTGSGPCQVMHHGEGITCINLPEFMATVGFGGPEPLQPWFEMWDVQE